MMFGTMSLGRQASHASKFFFAKQPRLLLKAKRIHFSVSKTSCDRTRLKSLPPLTRSTSSLVQRAERQTQRLLASDGILYAIIGANCAVFGMWQLATSRRANYFMYKHFTTSVDGIEDGRLHTLATSLFSHRSFTHFASNMMTLWFFGGEAIAIIGGWRFLQLYLTGGVVSSCCQVMYNAVKSEKAPMEKYRATLGASGGVNSILALSILLNPRRMLLLYFVIPVPAALLGVGFIVYDALGAAGYTGSGNIANVAHLGGAVVGSAYYYLKFRRF